MLETPPLRFFYNISQRWLDAFETLQDYRKGNIFRARPTKRASRSANAERGKTDRETFVCLPLRRGRPRKSLEICRGVAGPGNLLEIMDYVQKRLLYRLEGRGNDPEAHGLGYEFWGHSIKS